MRKCRIGAKDMVLPEYLLAGAVGVIIALARLPGATGRGSESLQEAHEQGERHYRDARLDSAQPQGHACCFVAEPA